MRIPIRLSVLIALVVVATAGVSYLFLEVTEDMATIHPEGAQTGTMVQKGLSEEEAQIASVSDAIARAETNEPLKVLGAIPYWDQARAFSVFKDHVDKFDIISLFWYRLDADGTIRKYGDAKEDLSIVRYAQQNGVKVLALIANLPEDANWDPKRVDAAIANPEDRRTHIEAIIALMEEKGFDGISIDYEFLQNRQKTTFTTFIKELGAELHARGKILTVAIHSQEPGTSTRGQDVVALAASADFLAYMTYDQYWDTSGPGPVASEPWMRGVLIHAITLGVDPKKIYLGMPLYGYDWGSEDKAKGLEYEDVQRIANSSSNITVQYDDEFESPHFTYGNERTVWFENARSFEAKYNLAEEFNLGGIHLWRLGREDKNVYDVIK